MTRQAAKDPQAGGPVGRWLRRLREAAGLSQAELARAAGVQTTTVGGWESGRTGMSARAADALDVDPAELGCAPAPVACSACGAVFTPRRGTAAACSQECRRRARRGTR